MVPPGDPSCCRASSSATNRTRFRHRMVRLAPMPPSRSQKGPPETEDATVMLTPGNVHDTTPVPALTRDLTGKLFGDKGYIGRKLAEDLLRRGLTLFTRVRKNMKSLPLSLQDRALLNARNMAETIIGHIKEF